MQVKTQVGIYFDKMIHFTLTCMYLSCTCITSVISPAAALFSLLLPALNVMSDFYSVIVDILVVSNQYALTPV